MLPIRVFALRWNDPRRYPSTTPVYHLYMLDSLRFLLLLHYTIHYSSLHLYYFFTKRELLPARPVLARSL
jgi:hypothetical protein